MRARDDMRGPRQRRFRIAALDEALGQQIARRGSSWSSAAPSAQRLGRFAARAAARVQSIGKSREVEVGDRRALAGDQRHRLAAETRDAFGQRRLVGEGRDRRRSSCCPECPPP